MLQDRGLLVPGAGRMGARRGGRRSAGSLQGIIAARLDTLSPDEKALIQDAAVVGKTAWVGAVCALRERSGWEAEGAAARAGTKTTAQRIRRSSIQAETEFPSSATRSPGTSPTDRSAAQTAPRSTRRRQRGSNGSPLGRDDKAELPGRPLHPSALAARRDRGGHGHAVPRPALAAFTEAGRPAAATHAHGAAARHYRAALALTSRDRSSRPRRAAAGSRDRPVQCGRTHYRDPRRSTASRGSRWISGKLAAQVEPMMGRWYQEGGALMASEAALHLEQGRRYAARVATERHDVHDRLRPGVSVGGVGLFEEALRLVTEMIPLAERAGLEVGRALLLIWRGSARVELGDTDGVMDMRDAANTLARHAHQRTDRRLRQSGRHGTRPW